MPPQNTPPTPQAPNNFDFMMKDQPKPPGRFGSLLSGVPKPAKIALVVIGALFILVILYATFFGGKASNADQLTSVAARAQEIVRVSVLVQTAAQNADTKALAATTSETLASQEQELKSYLKSNKIKVNVKKLAAKLDKTSDTALATALQNNNYDQAYFDYLKTNLASYQTDLNTANKGAGKKAQAILRAAYQSVQTLLSAPQLK